MNVGNEYSHMPLGYNKIRTSASATHQSPINGYDGPFSLPAAVNADNTVSNPGELIGTQNFKKSYDPSVCARLCDGINQSRKLEIEQQCASRLDAKQCAWKRTYAPILGLHWCFADTSKHATTSILMH